jgi:putative PIN family toxin of toxin-antitoxin system
MRVLVDTNVLVSFLLGRGEGGAIRTIYSALLNGQSVLLLPEEIVEELIATVERKPRLARLIPADRLNSFVALLRQVAEPVAKLHEPIPAVTRDPDDDYVLAYALIASADHLVTGDRDLLVLSGQIPGLNIVTPAQFSQILTNDDLQR